MKGSWADAGRMVALRPNWALWVFALQLCLLALEVHAMLLYLHVVSAHWRQCSRAFLHIGLHSWKGPKRTSWRWESEAQRQWATCHKARHTQWQTWSQNSGPNLHPKAISTLPPIHHTFHLSSSEASSIIRSDTNQLGTGVWFNHSSTIFHEFIHTPQSPSGDSQTISAERQTQLFGSRVTLGARP